MNVVSSVLRWLLATASGWRHRLRDPEPEPGFTAAELRNTLACLSGCAEGWDPVETEPGPPRANRPAASPADHA